MQAGALGAVVPGRPGVAEDQFTQQGRDAEDGRIGRDGVVLVGRERRVRHRTAAGRRRREGRWFADDPVADRRRIGGGHRGRCSCSTPEAPSAPRSVGCSRAAPAEVRHVDGVTLLGAPLTEDTTVLGPVSALLYLSSSTQDADLFLTLDALDPDGNRVPLRDHRGGATPVSIGWQRASLRATDTTRSAPAQPFHPFDRAEPLTPHDVVAVEVELCPTALALPAGHRLTLTVRGHGPAHHDPLDRPTDVFANTVTLHAGPATPSHLLVPTIG